MKRSQLVLGALVALASSSVVNLASASSHREAPAISRDPAADNTDLWAWVESGTHDKLNIVASYIPLEEPSGGPNFNQFSDDVLYEIHVTRGNKSLRDVVTYQIYFDSTGFAPSDPADLKAPPGGGKEFFAQLSGSVQTYTVVRIDKDGARVEIAKAPVAPVNIGPRTSAVAYKPAGHRTQDLDRPERLGQC